MRGSPRPCRHCGGIIVWEKNARTGKWLPPRNEDGTQHICPEYEASRGKTPLADAVSAVTVAPKGKTLEMIILALNLYRENVPQELKGEYDRIVGEMVVLSTKVPTAPLPVPKKPVVKKKSAEDDFNPEKL